jgi:carboxymethylenebutenolidase
MKRNLVKILVLKILVLGLAVMSFARSVSVVPLLTAREVTYKSGDETVRAMMYTPQGQGGGRLPAIVVIHEYWGLNDWVKEQAQMLAERGYVALAIDLYRGKVATSPDEAHELMRALPEDRGVRDLKAAFAFLASQKNVNKRKIASIGWCMGGGWALKLAENQPELAATVMNYGAVTDDMATLRPIRAAVLGLFGGQDRGITPENVKSFEQAMNKLGKKVEVKIYPDAGHGFENPNNKPAYRAADATDAWDQIADFLKRTLG